MSIYFVIRRHLSSEVAPRCMNPYPDNVVCVLETSFLQGKMEPMPYLPRVSDLCMCSMFYVHIPQAELLLQSKRPICRLIDSGQLSVGRDNFFGTNVARIRPETREWKPCMTDEACRYQKDSHDDEMAI